MARLDVRVRPATEADLPAMLALGEELRLQLLPGAPRATGATARRQLEARYAEVMQAQDRQLVVAVAQVEGAEEVLGMGLMIISTLNALVDVPAVYLTNAVVADRFRRRGAGRALVASAAAYAEAHQIEQIVIALQPGGRDANRFLARLGFAPLDARRSASVGTVRRRLAGPERGATDTVLRRRMMRRTRDQGPDGGPPP